MANRKTNNTNKNSARKQPMTRAQIEERQAAARQKEQQAATLRAKADRKKKIFTVVICIILVLALGLPTVALSMLKF